MNEQVGRHAAAGRRSPDPAGPGLPRPGRGSLAGRIDRTDAGDGPDLGEELARGFGLLPSP